MLKNSRLISIEQDILLKLLLLKNGSAKLDKIGFKNVPEVSKTKGADSIDLGTGNFLNFDAAKTAPMFDVEQLKPLDQSESGVFYDIGAAVNLKNDYYLNLEIQ